jgi:transcriptional regulator
MYDQYIYWRLMPGTRELRKGSAELLILSLLDERDRHGYELAKLIERRSAGQLAFHVASLYPVLYRLERRGLIHGRWVEKDGERRRRFYRLPPQGVKTLAAERRTWQSFLAAVNRVTRLKPA